MEIKKIDYENLTEEKIFWYVDSIRGIDPRQLKTKEEQKYYYEIINLIPPKNQDVELVTCTTIADECTLDSPKLSTIWWCETRRN